MLLVFSSCASLWKQQHTDSKAVNGKSLCNPILKSPKAHTNVTEYAFLIEKLRVFNQCLKVNFQYEGGCGTKALNLYQVSIDQSIAPPVVWFSVEFLDQDPCREIISDSILFDLTDYESVARSGGIMIRLIETDQQCLFALPL